jgi:SpoVK/Ycf46/Vps4 family AAA+-type ATPase
MIIKITYFNPTRTLFKMAQFMQPSVVFIDEIDSLLSARSDGEMDAVRRIKTEFFVQLDGANTDENASILVIGTTNRPGELDEAARRRFVKRLYVPLPDKVARKELILRVKQTEGQLELNEEDIGKVVEKTKGYSCADMAVLIREVLILYFLFIFVNFI